MFNSRDFFRVEYYTITALERDQYEVLWSRVQQYCTLLHKTSYWSSSSVIIVLLHKILKNFEILYLWNVLKFYICEMFWNFEKFRNFEIFWNFEIFLKFLKCWNFLKIFKFYEILKIFWKILTFFGYIVWVLLNERVTFIDFARECNMIFYCTEIAFC
jgi:hypothetical protein